MGDFQLDGGNVIELGSLPGDRRYMCIYIYTQLVYIYIYIHIYIYITMDDRTSIT